jgi:hypothetical protein
VCWVGGGFVNWAVGGCMTPQVEKNRTHVSCHITFASTNRHHLTPPHLARVIGSLRRRRRRSCISCNGSLCIQFE